VDVKRIANRRGLPSNLVQSLDDSPARTWAGRVSAWFRRRVVGAVLDQLRRGITPEKVALTIALGALLGVFPVLGTTTVLCFAAAAVLGLNQPIAQLVNYLVYPLQIPLIYFFLRLGERTAGGGRVRFDLRELTALFAADPLSFVERFGVTGLHAILGWLLIAVPAVPLLYAVLVPLIRRAARRMGAATHKETARC
jgi:uncharacterized protein (DUF2062 family)